MGWDPVNLALRFVLAAAIPVLAAVLWSIFRVPNDPGPARVAVPGVARLALKLAIFCSAIWALADLGATTLRWVMGIVVAMHYLVI